MACGEMHLSYLVLLSSHIVGALTGQISIVIRVLFDFKLSTHVQWQSTADSKAAMMDVKISGKTTIVTGHAIFYKIWITDEGTMQRAKLVCTNWTDHLQPMIPEGLDKRSLKDIIGEIVFDSVVRELEIQNVKVLFDNYFLKSKPITIDLGKKMVFETHSYSWSGIGTLKLREIWTKQPVNRICADSIKGIEDITEFLTTDKNATPLIFS
ncbi:unnamed protein product [Sphenostylis stenocarpa]|uniref:Uncharacterized protein n=1 Tax=Sphenostylis stenocarpa TaxID=92480 RepID=A0AA86SAT1_9FABA|nr:unnamed protein product [Sphenostylis stenocarpa]